MGWLSIRQGRAVRRPSVGCGGMQNQDAPKCHFRQIKEVRSIQQSIEVRCALMSFTPAQQEFIPCLCLELRMYLFPPQHPYYEMRPLAPDTGVHAH